jgi:FAD/FMN-containing dehydrogenase
MVAYPPVESYPLELRAIANLRRRIAGELLMRGDPGYDEARAHWNAVVDRYPGFIVRPRDSRDVATAVAFARAFDLPLAVRSGGHNGAGLSLVDDGVVIDLSRYSAVRIDPERRIAWAQPGASNAQLVHAAAAHGLATTTGNASGVGLGGLTLGGGVGWLMGKHGLTIDNVLDFELVTADGRILDVSASEHPELFWALRGGGGNFGVVTAISYRLHPIAAVLAGRVAIPLAEAREGLRALEALNAIAPDELTTFALIASPPQLGPSLVVQVCYSGADMAEGERLLAPLRALGVPAADSIAARPYGDLYPLEEPPPTVGRRYAGGTAALSSLSDGAIEALLVIAASRPTPHSVITLHRLHGAAARVDIEDTAFALREPQYLVSIAAAWDTGPGHPNVQWVRGAEELLKPYGRPGRYVNFMGKGSAREVRAAYGPNYLRLARVKAQYDPENLFRLNQNILPGR